jgi:hypothetical protein
MIEKSDLFSTEPYNALYQALHHAANCIDYDNPGPLYEWIKDLPRASMTCHIVDALEECGYEIVKIKDTRV